MEILLDASAIMAVIIEEPEKEQVINITKNVTIVSPSMVPFEIANGLSKMTKRKIIDKNRMVNAFEFFNRIPIKIIETDIKKALEIAGDYNIYAYDAFYLESAKRLGLPLLTFDGNMARIGKEICLTILGGKDAGV
ncbi:MAG: type II toxin-antitoxin system VapC family toxin [Termitinemataceae bacterium]|nr:MAG: type II toxin-antitoxin system VapC family toxin [Termitinemataceae bacterium]